MNICVLFFTTFFNITMKYGEFTKWNKLDLKGL